jgi:hypothetical protein
VSSSYNPSNRSRWFGLFPFRSPLLGVSRESRSLQTNIRLKRTQLLLFSFPPGTEMFHFPGFASRECYFADPQFKTEGVSPFGNLRIKGYKPPPRSLSQVSHVLLRRPRPRHPPCTLMSLMRNFVYHNHFLQSDHPPLWKSSGLSITFAYSYVKNRCPSFETKTALGAVFERFRAGGLTAYPLLKSLAFGS